MGRQPPEFGRRLRELRVEAGFTQAFLAEKALLSEEAIGALERGIRRSPQRETVARLARALGLSAEGQAEFLELAARLRARDTRQGEPQEWHRSNVPVPVSRFFGRESEREALIECVKTGSRVATIAGTGGSGKTRLAIEAAHALEAHFSGDVCFVDLSSELPSIAQRKAGVPNAVEHRIAEGLHVTESGTHALLESLRFALVNRRILIVLDNCEHLIEDCAAVVSSLVHSLPSVYVMATSREPLRIEGEQVFRLSSLAPPAAAMLFMDRASNYLRSRTPAVDNIIRHLDGIPLAIELAAPRLEVLSVEQLERALEDRFRTLARGMRDAPRRHQTLRAVVDWSYDPLSSEVQVLLQILSAFSGGWNLETAAACVEECGLTIDVVDGVGSLTEKSLIVIDMGAENRYSMLETLHQYMTEKRNTAGNEDRIRAAHARTFAALAAKTFAKRRTMEEGIWFSEISPELSNYRSAMTWALIEKHDPILGARLASSLRTAFRHISPTEGLRWARIARDVLPENAPAEVRADLLVCLGGFAVQKRELTFGAYEEALELYRSVGNHLKAADTMGVLSQLYNRAQRTQDAVHLILEAIAYAREAGDRSLLAWLLLNQAGIEAFEGDREAILAESRLLNPQFDHNRAYELHLQGANQGAVGNFVDGRKLMYQAIELYERWPNVYRDNHSLALIEIGWHSLALDDLPEARRAARAGLRLSVEAGASDATIGAIRCLAVVSAYAGDAERALRLMTFAAAESWNPDSDSEAQIPMIREARVRIAGELDADAYSQIVDDAGHLHREAAIAEALNV